MVINALNSGARGFMADFEDSNSPYWANMVGGQVNLADAVRGHMEHSEGGKDYRLDEDHAVLLVRPRGLHLPERHLQVNGGEVAGAFADFGLYVHRNAEALLERGRGPYFYIPKLESAREAALWRDAFLIAEHALGLDRGTIKATVLIETVPAAFEMDAILYELRDHAAGLNAGRWDYIFSMIKRFRSRPEFVLPNRSDVTMTVPFMHAYSELLVRTCHARGAHAMGGMSAVIPSRTDEEANREAFEAVRADKQREAGAGFDGTWVAHPDSVPVATEAFDEVLGDRPNQVDRKRDDVQVGSDDLLSASQTPGEITEEGLRLNVNVGIQYISSWLRGNGAAAIYGLMEDAATAEISRAQVWQWIHHGEVLDDGRPVTPDLVRQLGGRGAGEDPLRDRRRRLVPRTGPARPVARSVRAGGAQRGRLRGVPDAAGVRRALEARALARLLRSGGGPGPAPTPVPRAGSRTPCARSLGSACALVIALGPGVGAGPGRRGW